MGAGTSRPREGGPSSFRRNAKRSAAILRLFSQPVPPPIQDDVAFFFSFSFRASAAPIRRPPGTCEHAPLRSRRAGQKFRRGSFFFFFGAVPQAASVGRGS